MKCLEEQDTEKLFKLKNQFSKPDSSLFDFMKWIFIGSVIAMFLTALFSGQVSYVHVPRLLPYLLLFIRQGLNISNKTAETVPKVLCTPFLTLQRTLKTPVSPE